MNISQPFIVRPVMTVLLMAALLLFGLLGYFSMPVNDLPTVDFPTIQVSASLSGASPETMASVVAQPLENHFATIPGISSMTSSSTTGQAQIVLQFDLDRDIDAAAQDVASAISQTQKQLPKEMSTPPSYKKVNPADSPIIYLALSSDILPMSEVDEYAENNLGNRITMLSGVAQVEVFGSQKYAVRIQMDPRLMAAHQLSMDQVITAVQNANVNLPTGMLNGEKQLRTINVSGQLFSAAAYQPLIVSYENGQPLRLNTVANVIDSVENNQVASWFNNKRAVVLAVYRQPGTNTLDVIKGVEKILPQFQAALPHSMNLTLFYERGSSIKASVQEVESNLLIATLLVVLVIFLFLKNLSATIIPGLVLPLTIIGTFAFMAFFGFSINNISLMGLTLAIGFFVDDAIVMLENILRHLEEGDRPLEAALKGSREIAFTILSMTLSLAAAFIPLVFMPGLLGRILHEFSVTLLLAIGISCFISLTLTPMMASRMLKRKEATHRFLILFDQWFAKLHQWYKEKLQWCLSHRRLVFFAWVGTILLTACLYWFVPKGFVPSEDIGLLYGNTETALDTSFTSMIKTQQQAADIIMNDPAVASLVSAVKNHNTGRFIIRLKPTGEREHASVVLNRLRNKLSNIPGFKAYLQMPAAITVGGKASKSQYQFTLQGNDLDQLYSYGDGLYQKLKRLSQLVDVTTDAEMTSPQVKVTIDREKAASMHVSVYTIENILANSLGSTQISTIYGQTDQFQVILEILPELQNSAAILQELYVESDDGHLVPLGSLAKFEYTVGPEMINHQNQTPSVTISYDVRQGYQLGQATDAVQKVVTAMHLPETMTAGFQGSAQAFQSSLKGYALLIFFAIAVIYILLGILYESFIHPITILSSLPTAGIGALLLLILTGQPLDIYGFIGLLMLIGIVKKNGIIMIDFALVRQRAGMLPKEAIFEACAVRFRPIMMTTFAAFMGALPIVFAMGPGGDARRSLGLAVVGGLLSSQILTLFSTPIIYLYLEEWAQKMKQRHE